MGCSVTRAHAQYLRIPCHVFQDKAYMLGLRKVDDTGVRIRLALLLYDVYALRNHVEHKTPNTPLPLASALSFLQFQAKLGTWGHAAARRALLAALEESQPNYF